MKRILSLLLIFVLCAGMCACEAKADATDIYLAAKEKTDALSSFDATMKVSVKYKSGGKETGNSSTVYTQLDRRSEGAPVYYSRYNIKDLSIDQEYVSSMYYADNVVYEMSGMGEKYKTMVSVESIESAFSSVSMDIPAEVFGSCVVKGNTVKASAKADKVAELIEPFLSGVSTYYSSVDGDGSFDFDYSDVDIEFATDENGYFEYTLISFSVNFLALEGKVSAKVFHQITFNDPGEEVNITPPDDISEYTWYEEGDKTQEELEGEMMEEILAMFDFEDGKATRVANFDELYAIACTKYTKETVDMYVQTIETLGSLKG